MNLKKAKSLLQLKNLSTEEEIRHAYLERVKSSHNDENFEETLTQLNIARDFLLEKTSNSRELVPVLAKELAEISAKQNQLVEVNEAREKMRDSLVFIERRRVKKIRGIRDFAGLLSAASAGLAFGQNNLSELVPTLTDNVAFSQALLLTSAFLALSAYMANRRANSVTDEIEQSDIN